MDLMKIAEQAFATGKELPEFFPGDTITVAYRIKEGNKERIQQYRGVVIKITGEGTKKRFTVRKISDNIVINKHGKVVAPSCTTCVGSPARRLASKSAASSSRRRPNRGQGVMPLSEVRSQTITESSR